MSLTSITVLCPNARRVPIKVTPSTLLRKVKDEACLSQGFDPTNHVLHHHKKVLDLALPLRLTGLPNNATLDLVESAATSAVQDVTVALQLSDSRHEVACKTTDSLFDVIKSVSESSGNDLISRKEEGMPCCNYMNKQYRGESELSYRTLGSIGVTGGRILIRYSRIELSDEQLENIDRMIGEEKTEVERLNKKFDKARLENEARQKRDEESAKQLEELRKEEERRIREEAEAAPPPPPVSVPDRLPSPPPQVASTNGNGWAFDHPFVAPPPPSIDSSTVSHQPSQSINSSTVPQQDPPRRTSRLDALQALLQNVNDDLMMSSHGSSAIVESVADMGRLPVDAVTEILSSATESRMERITEPLPDRCERQGLYFPRLLKEEASTREEEELGEEFYELTVEDLKNIQKGHRDAVRNQAQRALLPRSTVEAKNTERKLSAYKHVAIRFQLPNEYFIQGQFLPHEPVWHLTEFLKSIIGDDFSLRYITQKISKEEKKTILALDMAPKATLTVSIQGEIKFLDNAPVRECTVDEADEVSRQWLSCNSTFVPYSPTVVAEPPTAGTKRLADLSPTSQRRTLPDSVNTGPKWLKKK